MMVEHLCFLKDFFSPILFTYKAILWEQTCLLLKSQVNLFVCVVLIDTTIEQGNIQEINFNEIPCDETF